MAVVTRQLFEGWAMAKDSNPDRPSAPRMFTNWGDHPIIVGASVLIAAVSAGAALIAAGTAVFQVLKDDPPPKLRSPPPTLDHTPIPHHTPQWLGDRAPNSVDLTDIGIAVADDTSRWSAPVAAEIARAIADQRAGVRVVHMTEAFVHDGAFASLFAGNRSSLERVDLSRYVDWLLLVKISSKCAAHPTYASVRTCRSSAEGLYIDARTGAITRPTSTDAASSGRTTAEAQAQTWERIARVVAADAP